MKVNGKKINSTARAWKHGMMVLRTEELMLMGKSTVRVTLSGEIKASTKENL